jgi:hypothetical protein
VVKFFNQSAHYKCQLYNLIQTWGKRNLLYTCANHKTKFVHHVSGNVVKGCFFGDLSGDGLVSICFAKGLHPAYGKRIMFFGPDIGSRRHFRRAWERKTLCLFRVVFGVQKPRGMGVLNIITICVGLIAIVLTDTSFPLKTSVKLSSISNAVFCSVLTFFNSSLKSMFLISGLNSKFLIAFSLCHFVV